MMTPSCKEGKKGKGLTLTKAIKHLTASLIEEDVTLCNLGGRY
jgi:hypothetical protein